MSQKVFLIGLVAGLIWFTISEAIFIFAVRSVLSTYWLLASIAVSAVVVTKLWQVISHIYRGYEVNNANALIVVVVAVLILGIILTAGFYAMARFFSPAMIMVWGGLGLCILTIGALLISSLMKRKEAHK